MADISKDPERFPTENLQVLTHFYRGEVQRETDWRHRLDLTTNWAIITTMAAFSWTFSSVNPADFGSHIVLLFASFLVFLLMCIEARRYRYYDIWHTRVRMLEVHILVPALNPDKKLLQGDWRSVLSDDLLMPSYKISFHEALAQRLRANYGWLFLGLLAGWILRIAVDISVSEGTKSFSEASGIGFPGSSLLIICFQVVFILYLLFVVLGTWKVRGVTGEIRRRDKNARKWPI
ncbi:MAG: DUF2270 domain-containing protein [Planctomycetota bacterium]